MPDRTFLEEFALYRKFPITERDISFPPIQRYCDKCMEKTTWTSSNKPPSKGVHALLRQELPPSDPDDMIKCGEYTCTICSTSKCTFFIRRLSEVIRQPDAHQIPAFLPRNWFVMKVGQWPPWSIEIPKPVAKALRAYKERYKHGSICESQGYGIGAFAYYRQIVEGIIDELLDAVAEIIPEGEDRNRYTEALEKTKQSRVAQDKIDLVKDLLPTSLRPDGMNPLGVMHHALSEGLHALDDEECLNIGAQLRTALEFFIGQIDVVRSSRKQFTEGMRKLLEKKQQ